MLRRANWNIFPERQWPKCATIAILLAASLYLSLAPLVASALTSTPTKASEGVAAPVIKRLLRHPSRLQLIGSKKSKQTFFFRVQAERGSPGSRIGLLAASKLGRTTLLVSGANGMDYAYYGDGLSVFVDVKRPGTLDVYRNLSPGFLVGGQPGTKKVQSGFAFEIYPVGGRTGLLAMDLSVPLRAAEARSDAASYSPSDRTLAFHRTGAAFIFKLAPPKSAFSILAVTLLAKNGTLNIWNISPNAQPMRKLFGVTLKGLKATGVPLRIRDYRAGEVLPWLPPDDFGAKQGEIQASAALARLLPLSASRERHARRRWLRRQIAALEKSSTKDKYPHSAIAALSRIYARFESGVNSTVDAGSMRTGKGPAYTDLRWQFDRNAYQKMVRRAWGKKQMDELTRGLIAIVLNRDSRILQRFLAADLLSDMGPNRLDKNFTAARGPLARAFSRKTPRMFVTLLVALFRARWGLPLTPQDIKAAKTVLASNGQPPLRLRALEILCFADTLPEDRQMIAKLVKTSLDNPQVCLESPAGGRYLFDLSLCRTGRQILLAELADRTSQLYSNPMLPVAAFNRLFPGSPGFNSAMATAMRIVRDRKYGEQMRDQAAHLALSHAAMPMLRKFVLEFLKPDSRHLEWALNALSFRRMAGNFSPELIDVLRHADKSERLPIMEAVAYGFKPHADANSAAPIIAMALADKNPKTQWLGLLAIGMIRYVHAKLDVTAFYARLLQMVRHGSTADLPVAAHALFIFSMATNDGWKVPAAGLKAGGVYTWGRGEAWWTSHYAAVRKSALAWAAAHPAAGSAK